MRLLLVCLLAAVCSFDLSSAAVSSGHGNVPLVTKVDFEPTPTLFNYPPNHHKKNGFCSEIKITFTLSPEAKLADVDHSGLFSLRRTATSQAVYDDHLLEAQRSQLKPLEWPVDAQSHQLNSAKLTEIFGEDAKRKGVDQHKVSEDSPNFQNVVCDEEHKKIVVTDCPGPTMQAAVSDAKLYPVMFQGEFTLTLVYYREKADVALKKGIKLAEVSYSTVNGKKAITSSVAPDIIYEKAAVKGDIFIAKDSSTPYVEPVVQSVTLEEADRINKFQCWEHQLKPHKSKEPSSSPNEDPLKKLKKTTNQTPLSPSLPDKKGHRRTGSSGGGKAENTLKRTGSGGNMKQRKALSSSK